MKLAAFVNLLPFRGEREGRGLTLKLLEGTDFVSQSFWGYVGFEFIASSNVDSLRKQLLDFGHDPGVIEQVYGSPTVEVEDQINVAVRTLGPACCGTEQREVFDAELLEARRSGPENVENRGNFPRVGGGRSRG